MAGRASGKYQSIIVTRHESASVYPGPPTHTEAEVDRLQVAAALAEPFLDSSAGRTWVRRWSRSACMLRKVLGMKIGRESHAGAPGLRACYVTGQACVNVAVAADASPVMM